MHISAVTIPASLVAGCSCTIPASPTKTGSCTLFIARELMQIRPGIISMATQGRRPGLPAGRNPARPTRPPLGTPRSRSRPVRLRTASASAAFLLLLQQDKVSIFAEYINIYIYIYATYVIQAKYELLHMYALHTKHAKHELYAKNELYAIYAKYVKYASYAIYAAMTGNGTFSGVFQNAHHLFFDIVGAKHSDTGFSNAEVICLWSPGRFANVMQSQIGTYRIWPKSRGIFQCFVVHFTQVYGGPLQVMIDPKRAWKFSMQSTSINLANTSSKFTMHYLKTHERTMALAESQDADACSGIDCYENTQSAESLSVEKIGIKSSRLAKEQVAADSWSSSG